MENNNINIVKKDGLTPEERGKAIKYRDEIIEKGEAQLDEDSLRTYLEYFNKLTRGLDDKKEGKLAYKHLAISYDYTPYKDKNLKLSYLDIQAFYTKNVGVSPKGYLPDAIELYFGDQLPRLFYLDIDKKKGKDGEAEFNKMAKDLSIKTPEGDLLTVQYLLDHTLAHKTKSGGYHIFFELPNTGTYSTATHLPNKPELEYKHTHFKKVGDTLEEVTEKVICPAIEIKKHKVFLPTSFIATKDGCGFYMPYLPKNGKRISKPLELRGDSWEEFLKVLLVGSKDNDSEYVGSNLSYLDKQTFKYDEVKSWLNKNEKEFKDENVYPMAKWRKTILRLFSIADEGKFLNDDLITLIKNSSSWKEPSHQIIIEKFKADYDKTKKQADNGSSKHQDKINFWLREGKILLRKSSGDSNLVEFGVSIKKISEEIVRSLPKESRLTDSVRDTFSAFSINPSLDIDVASTQSLTANYAKVVIKNTVIPFMSFLRLFKSHYMVTFGDDKNVTYLYWSGKFWSDHLSLKWDDLNSTHVLRLAPFRETIDNVLKLAGLYEEDTAKIIYNFFQALEFAGVLKGLLVEVGAELVTYLQMGRQDDLLPIVYDPQVIGRKGYYVFPNGVLFHEGYDNSKTRGEQSGPGFLTHDSLRELRILFTSETSRGKSLKETIEWPFDITTMMVKKDDRHDTLFKLFRPLCVRARKEYSGDNNTLPPKEIERHFFQTLCTLSGYVASYNKSPSYPTLLIFTGDKGSTNNGNNGKSLYAKFLESTFSSSLFRTETEIEKAHDKLYDLSLVGLNGVCFDDSKKKKHDVNGLNYEFISKQVGFRKSNTRELYRGFNKPFLLRNDVVIIANKVDNSFLEESEGSRRRVNVIRFQNSNTRPLDEFTSSAYEEAFDELEKLGFGRFKNKNLFESYTKTIGGIFINNDIEVGASFKKEPELLQTVYRLRSLFILELLESSNDRHNNDYKTTTDNFSEVLNKGITHREFIDSSLSFYDFRSDIKTKDNVIKYWDHENLISNSQYLGVLHLGNVVETDIPNLLPKELMYIKRKDVMELLGVLFNLSTQPLPGSDSTTQENLSQFLDNASKGGIKVVGDKIRRFSTQDDFFPCIGIRLVENSQVMSEGHTYYKKERYKELLNHFKGQQVISGYSFLEFLNRFVKDKGSEFADGHYLKKQKEFGFDFKVYLRENPNDIA